MSTATSLVTMSAKAQGRLRKPRTRGAFAPIDAAKRQLGLLAVSDSAGQARLFWLVDLPTSTIADARFLAFGDLPSHPIMDAFTESVRGRTVVDACRLTAEQLEALLRDDPVTPAFGDLGLKPLAFLRELQDRAEALLPTVVLLPKPIERQVYQRKREADQSEADKAWFKLSLLKKIAKVDGISSRVLSERLHGDAKLSIEGLHDDFRIVVKLTGLAPEQVPTALQLIQDALHTEVHPDLLVEELSAKAKP
ncbi:MAG TPA: iron-sulfur cluster assembly scaffold protein [Planctomycetota bacterium]|nr:iron-sulfur cluster assembly scaffold protein [Planctomycetota bacterium]